MGEKIAFVVVVAAAAAVAVAAVAAVVAAVALGEAETASTCRAYLLPCASEVAEEAPGY
jgi:hypothetical protein